MASTRKRAGEAAAVAPQRADVAPAPPAAAASTDPGHSTPEGDEAAPPAPQPVRAYRIERPAPVRAGGYVLTQRGWVLDATEQNGG